LFFVAWIFEGKEEEPSAPPFLSPARILPSFGLEETREQ
jgi:hypothetical protein